ncbi:MAG: transposase [Candidatus Accumulibacter sp.]|jgi:hypothetical protein|nr:transposase [Accumulibacter sp.]
MAMVDRQGLPPAVGTHTAKSHEVTCVQPNSDFYMIETKLDDSIGDKAYGSGKLDAELREEGIEMISPHRSNRKDKKTQDGRRLRHYTRRWLTERLLAWLPWHAVSWPDGNIAPRIFSASYNALRSKFY